MAERILYLESVAGIAGDMFSAAFLDAGLVGPEEMEAVPRLLGADEVQVKITRSERSGAMATHLDVVLPGGETEADHLHSAPGPEDHGPSGHHTGGHDHHGHHDHPGHHHHHGHPGQNGLPLLDLNQRPSD
ncbi:MAG: nickel insertion protein [Longimicrobiales bacterium]